MMVLLVTHIVFISIFVLKAPIASEEEVNDSWYTDSSSQYSDYIQSEDGPTEGGLVKALVEEAKADAKAAIDHYAKKANKEVDQCLITCTMTSRTVYHWTTRRQLVAKSEFHV